MKFTVNLIIKLHCNLIDLLKSIGAAPFLVKFGEIFTNVFFHCSWSHIGYQANGKLANHLKERKQYKTIIMPLIREVECCTTAEHQRPRDATLRTRGCVCPTY